MHKLIPRILFSLLGKIFDPTRKALAVRMLNRLFRKNPRGNFRSPIGASINHTNDLAAEIVLAQFGKEGLLQQGMKRPANRLLLVPRKNSDRDQDWQLPLARL